MFLKRKLIIGWNQAALNMASMRNSRKLAGRQKAINYNKFAAYTTSSTWKMQINGQATLCTTMTTIFLLIAYPVDWCKYPISINLAISKQEKEVKAFIFVKEK